MRGRGIKEVNLKRGAGFKSTGTLSTYLVKTQAFLFHHWVATAPSSAPLFGIAMVRVRWSYLKVWEVVLSSWSSSLFSLSLLILLKLFFTRFTFKLTRSILKTSTTTPTGNYPAWPDASLIRPAAVGSALSDSLMEFDLRLPVPSFYEEKKTHQSSSVYSMECMWNWWQTVCTTSTGDSSTR